jgi:hypothetical protein
MNGFLKMVLVKTGWFSNLRLDTFNQFPLLSFIPVKFSQEHLLS